MVPRVATRGQQHAAVSLPLATGEENEVPARKGPSSHPQSHTNRHLLSTCFGLGPFPTKWQSWGPPRTTAVCKLGSGEGGGWRRFPGPEFCLPRDPGQTLDKPDKEKALDAKDPFLLVGDRKLSRFPGLELGQRRARGHKRGHPVPGGRSLLPVGLMVLSSSSKGNGREFV